jgi:hypothetical protein
MDLSVYETYLACITKHKAVITKPYMIPDPLSGKALYIQHFDAASHIPSRLAYIQEQSSRTCRDRRVVGILWIVHPFHRESTRAHVCK